MNKFNLWSKNFILICISNFLYFGSFYLLLPTLPQYVGTLGGTTTQIGLVMGAFTLSSVVFRPYLGKATDRYGRKKFMLIGAGAFALLFVVYAQLSTIAPLFILRILHGIPHGCFLAASYAYIADYAPLERRGEVMGIYGVTNVISMALFPAIGSTIIAGTNSFTQLFTISCIAGAVAFLAILFIDEIRPQTSITKQKTSSLAVIKKKSVLVASLTLFTAATAYGTIITFLPVYAPNRGILNFGIFFTTYAVFTLISRLVAGKLSDKFGRRKVIIPFLGLVALAVLMLPFLNNVLLLILVGGCFGLGFGAFMPALNAFVVDETLPQERASALAFFSAFMDVGITTGSVILGIVAQFAGYGKMFGLAGIIVLMGIAVFAFNSKNSVSAQN